MKRFFIFIFCLAWHFSNEVNANNHKKLNDNPIQVQQNFIGLSNSFFTQTGPSIFFSFHDHNPAFGNSNFHTHTFFDPFTDARETINTTSIEAQYYIIKQIAFGIKLPYHIHKRTYKNESIKKTGIGDAMFYALYHIYNSQYFNPNENGNHLITALFQIHAPTGIYRQPDELNDIEPHFQNGVGSFNFDLMLDYQFLLNNWKFNLSSVCHINQKNYYQFKVGNSLVSRVAANYNFHFYKLKLNVLTGIDYTVKKSDSLENENISEPNRYDGFGSFNELSIQYKKTKFIADFFKVIQYQYDDLSMQQNHNWELKIQYLF